MPLQRGQRTISDLLPADRVCTTEKEERCASSARAGCSTRVRYQVELKKLIYNYYILKPLHTDIINAGMERFLKDTILNKSDIIYAYPLSEILTARIKLTCHK